MKENIKPPALVLSILNISIKRKVYLNKNHIILLKCKHCSILNLDDIPKKLKNSVERYLRIKEHAELANSMKLLRGQVTELRRILQEMSDSFHATEHTWPCPKYSFQKVRLTEGSKLHHLKLSTGASLVELRIDSRRSAIHILWNFSRTKIPITSCDLSNERAYFLHVLVSMVS